MIKANAGKMRGVRVMRDPDGVLFSPFEDEMGGKYGYVVVYGEGFPAVHDGEQWHSISTMSEEEWDNSLQSLIVEQGTKIAQAAGTNPIYAELAKVMNIMVAADVNAPSNSVFTFGAN